jgi:putative ABC transport system substrate-binding protein
MKRRTIRLVVILALSLVSTLGTAAAQPLGKVPRIGFLEGTSAAASAPVRDAFLHRLRELGWVEGQTMVMEWRYAEGQFDRFRDLAIELVRLQVDVIVSGAAAIPVLKEATQTIPIVMRNVPDPVQRGFVASLARPGGNMTGVVNLTSELNAKRLELLKEAVPSLTRLAVLVNAFPSRSLQDFEDMARSMGVQLQPLVVRRPDDLDSVLEAMHRGHAEALLVFGSALHALQVSRIADLALKGRLPTISEFRSLVEQGGLMMYGPSEQEMIRRAATYVDKILKGATPADLPVERPMKFELIINLKTAKAFGITFPLTLLALADEVIQ